jgi:hypothetical protein
LNQGILLIEYIYWQNQNPLLNMKLWEDSTQALYETYAGQYGTFKYEFSAVPDEDAVKYFEDLGKFCIAAHASIDKKDTHLHNILDEVTGSVYHLLYKLKNLK